MNFFRKILLPGIVVFSFHISPAQTDTAQKIYYPVPVQLAASKNFGFNSCSLCLIEKFFPIGWSKDGNFAFATEPVDEACGCYYFSLEIINLAKDSFVWYFSYNSEEGGFENNNKDSGATHKQYLKRQQIWQGEYARFSKKLNQFKIIPSVSSSFEKFPMPVNNEKIDLSLKESLKFHGADFNDSAWCDSVVLIKNNSVHAQQLVRVEYNYRAPLDRPVEGYLKSPYENAGVIVLVYEQEGWEGPPEIYVYHIIGFSLYK